MFRMFETTGHDHAGRSKSWDFSPAQSRHAKTRRSVGKAADDSKPEAYPLGRTVRRIRSTTSVRAAEW